MVQPSHDPYKCIECYQAFDARVPSSYPRNLECKHCVCTECLSVIIDDLTRLQTCGLRPTSSSNLTCKQCGRKSRIYSNKMDRFPIDSNLMDCLKSYQRAGCQHPALEKFCNVCSLRFCSPCMLIHSQIHQASSLENKLEGLYRKHNHDVQDLRLATYTGRKQLEEHYHNLLQSLKTEYHSTLDRFNQRSSRIENRFGHDINTILTQKDRLRQQRRAFDGRSTSALAKSILDSESLINRLHEQSNRVELDNLSAIASSFSDLTLQRKHHTNPLPAIFSAGAGAGYNPVESASEASIHNPHMHIYDQRPSTVDYAAPVPRAPPYSPAFKQYMSPTQSILPPIHSPRQSPYPLFRPLVQHPVTPSQQLPPSSDRARHLTRTPTPNLSPLHTPRHFRNS